MFARLQLRRCAGRLPIASAPLFAPVSIAHKHGTGNQDDDDSRLAR